MGAEFPEEDVDNVPGQRAVTAWKQAARRHQSTWRELQGLEPGTQKPRNSSSKKERPLGSRLQPADAEAGKNFLTDAAWHAANHRVKHPQPRQMLQRDRLYGDLLSSMPMCFNLFGPLWDDPALARAVARRWFPDFCPADADVRVEFEWSPGRGNPKWLDDHTAFDAVVFVAMADGERRLIGIETKYHEHPTTASPTRRNKKTGQIENRPLKPRYREVTATAGLCDDSAIDDEIWGTDLEQIWRDHMLALACQQHPDEGWADVRYVLVAPAGNPAWSALSERYLDALPAAAATFEYRSVDDLVDSAADLLPHAAAFSERYLDVEVPAIDQPGA